VIERLKSLRQSRPLHLAASLVLLTASALFFAELMGIGKDSRVDQSESRKMIVESLAVQLTTLASIENIPAVEYSIIEFVRRNDLVLAARLNDGRGALLVQSGDASRIDDQLTHSTLEQIIVPIFDGRRAWGEVHVAFEPVNSTWHMMRYFLVVMLVAFAGYAVFLTRALVLLDPGAVVPKRVSTAFDMFSDAVIVLDYECRVVFTNASASAILTNDGMNPIGKFLEDWPWHISGDASSPWQTCLSSGRDIAGQSLRLGDDPPRRFMANCSMIGGEDQQMKGMLVTLDDVTELEETNQELSSTLTLISRKNEELEQLANRDSLSGLLNRRAFMETFQSALETAQSHDKPLGCIMLDIDHFKRVNDTYGHGIGDEVICAVATTLRRECRATDLIGRYGGEEYVVALPDTDTDATALVAEKVRLAVSQLSKEPAFPLDTLTISLGVHEYLHNDDALSALIDRADQALYAAKQGGRNRVVAYDPASEAFKERNETGDSLENDPSSARVDELEFRLGQRERDIELLRNFDSLTGSPRQVLFQAALDGELQRAIRSEKHLGVMALEICDLPNISASYGTTLVDALLIQFVQRLHNGLRRTDLVAEISTDQALSRLANNDFAVLLKDLDDFSQAIPVLTRLRRMLSMPFELEGHTLYIGVKIGIALLTPATQKSDRLLESAIQAKHAAEVGVEKFCYNFASNSLSEVSRRYIELESNLFKAVDNGDFQVHYQPKQELTSGKIVGVEALIRWSHADHGLISPESFIPVAESSGLIHDIFSFVLQDALENLGKWRAAGHTNFRVAINVSALQLRDTSFVMDTLTRIAEAGVPTKQLVMELTETSVIDSPNRVKIALGQLRDAGIGISMDDFGTGYTSLSLLADLPLDEVKIDRSFIVALSSGDRSHAIVESVVRMAHALKLRVIAEGVETIEQFDTLRRLGCDEVQGYLISKPVPSAEIAVLLSSKTRSQNPRRAA